MFWLMARIKLARDGADNFFDRKADVERNLQKLGEVTKALKMICVMRVFKSGHCIDFVGVGPVTIIPSSW